MSVIENIFRVFELENIKLEWNVACWNLQDIKGKMTNFD
jgi:hypothetical protein